MNSSKTMLLFAAMALIILFVFPAQSMSIDADSENLPARHKRWTFNTWRLHGRRQLSNDFSTPQTSPLDEDHHYDAYDTENDMARFIHEHLIQYFKKYNRQ